LVNSRLDSLKRAASASACACCAASWSTSVARPARASATSRNALCTAFSYCAVAMSRCASLTRRLLRVRPASKTGSVTCGMKLHAWCSNRWLSEPLAVP